MIGARITGWVESIYILVESMFRLRRRKGVDKILQIRVYDEDSYVWPALCKRRHVETLTVAELIDRYRGFEGELVDVLTWEGLVASLPQKLASDPDQRYLYLRSESDPLPPWLESHFLSVGWDVGIVLDDEILYSSVFNEVLFGVEEELIEWNNRLNEHLLMPSANVAKLYMDLHHRMLTEGRDVEGEEDMRVFQVWFLQSRASLKPRQK
jgi:hypothetical protein